MRTVALLLTGLMVGSVAAGQDAETLAPESLETEIFRLATTGVGIVERPEPSARGEAAAETIEDFLRNSGIPWPGGSDIVYNEKSGTLVVTNTPSNMVLVRELIRLWDQPALQVEIEGRFVKVLHARCLESTPEGRLLSLVVSALAGTTRLPEHRLAQPPAADADRMLRPRAILRDPEFQFICRALDGKDWSELLFAPRVTTISGQRAVVDVDPKEPGLRMILDVTPTVSADGRMIALVLSPQVAIPHRGKQADMEATEPSQDESLEITTTVYLKDGETVVLGGSMRAKAGDHADARFSVLIFVTARLVNPASFGHGGSRQEGWEGS